MPYKVPLLLGLNLPKFHHTPIGLISLNVTSDWHAWCTSLHDFWAFRIMSGSFSRAHKALYDLILCTRSGVSCFASTFHLNAMLQAHWVRCRSLNASYSNVSLPEYCPRPSDFIHPWNTSLFFLKLSSCYQACSQQLFRENWNLFLELQMYLI